MAAKLMSAIGGCASSRQCVSAIAGVSFGVVGSSERSGEESRGAVMKWYWCLHCERVYQAPERDQLTHNDACPECGAFAAVDAFDWSHIRLAHPEYPEVPEPDRAYPMY